MSRHSVEKFNTVCGNPPKTVDNTKEEIWKQLSNQSNILKEEMNELLDACDAEDIVEVLDAVVDMYFVLDYFPTIFKSLGIDFAGASYAVDENNATKFSRSLELITKSAKAHNDNGNPCYTEGVKYGGDYYYVVKRVSDNKVQKPVDFVPVDLKPCIPEDVMLKLSSHLM